MEKKERTGNLKQCVQSRKELFKRAWCFPKLPKSFVLVEDTVLVHVIFINYFYLAAPKSISLDHLRTLKQYSSQVCGAVCL